MQILKAEKSKDYDKDVARNCLFTLTGRFFRTNEEWLKWNEQTRAEKAPGEPKK